MKLLTGNVCTCTFSTFSRNNEASHIQLPGVEKIRITCEKLCFLTLNIPFACQNKSAAWHVKYIFYVRSKYILCMLVSCYLPM